MGFDVIHMNLHKTFPTPHGGSGWRRCGRHRHAPAALPADPLVGTDGERYRWLDRRDLPQSRLLSAFIGLRRVLLRAYLYAPALARGMHPSVVRHLNANYLLKLLGAGFDAAYRSAARATSSSSRQAPGARAERTAMDFASACSITVSTPDHLLPLLVPECPLIEPTETESRTYWTPCGGRTDPEGPARTRARNSAPHTMPVRRLDDAGGPTLTSWKPMAQP
jgi:glycine dehydrogenase subunit 2